MTSIATGPNLPHPILPVGFEIVMPKDSTEVVEVEVYPRHSSVELIVYPFGFRLFVLPGYAYIEYVHAGGDLPLVSGPVEAAAWAPQDWGMGHAVQTRPELGGSAGEHDLTYVAVRDWPSFHRAKPLRIGARCQQKLENPTLLKGLVMTQVAHPAASPMGGFRA